MRIAICGAGIAGLALALRLDMLGHEVIVVEKAPGPRTQGYMMDFFGPGYDAAEALGLLPRLRELAYDVDEAVYLDERGRRRAAVDYTQFGKALQGRLLSLMRPDLEQALREGLSGKVDLRFGTSVAAVEERPSGVRVSLTDGTEIDGDLLVGADGVHSTVRRLVFGPEETFIRLLGMHTAAFVFDDPAIYAAMQGKLCLTDTAGRQIGIYTLRDGQVAVFAVHRTTDATLPGDPRPVIRREYASLGWITPQVLNACPPADDIYYDLVAQVELPAWSSGHVTLTGDACQAVSLMAGQGASLAIAGAYVLAGYLDQSSSIESALERYERDWRPVVAEKQRVGRASARWFLPGSGLELWIRRVGMKLARLPGLDRYLSKALLGKPTTLIEQITHAATQGSNPAHPATTPRERKEYG